MKPIFLYLFTCTILISFSHCKPEVKENKLSGAFEAMQLMSEARAYPLDDIPGNVFQKAVKEHELLSSQSNNKYLVDPWEAMGPHNTAGRTLALAINPQADSTIYLGSASGGLWRSRSLGLGVSWEYIPTAPGVLGVSSIAFANGDSTEMYIGTGEVYNNSTTGDDAAYRATRGSYGAGILKSGDGGASWEKVLDREYADRFGVQSIQVSNTNASFVYAATTEGVFVSKDGGSTWSNSLDLPMATDVEIHRSDEKIAVAAFGNLGSTVKALFRTLDGGDTWFELATTTFPDTYNGKIELTSAASDPNVFYASIGNGFTSADGATWLYRSADGGLTWTLMNTADYSRWQGWFAHDVAVHPADENRILAVGIDVWSSHNGGANLVKTSSGGVTLGQAPIGEPDGDVIYSHSDHHVALFHPRIPDLAFVGNDGGLFHVTQDGTSFRSANGALQTTQFYNGFAVSHQNPDFALGGLQDNSTVMFTGTKAWTRTIGGDGSYSGINYDDDQIVYASWQNLNVLRSSDGGLNFGGMNLKQGDDIPVFIAPYEISEDDPNVMYAGSQYVYKTFDKGDFWIRGNAGVPLNGDPIFTIGLSPVDQNTLMMGTAPFGEPSALFVSTDGGVAFNEIDMGELPDRFINDIIFDPIDQNRVYITMNGFNSGHLFVTDDLGVTWSDLSENLPNAPGNAIAVDPENPENIYFGNDLGVYVSTDYGASWEVFAEGVVGSFIAMDLEVSPVDRKLWMVTHGRGAYRRDLLPKTSFVFDPPNGLERNLTIELNPNPVNIGQRFSISVDSKISTKVRIEMVDGKGRVISVIKESGLIHQGENLFELTDPGMSAGSYYIRITDGTNLITKTVIYQ